MTVRLQAAAFIAVLAFCAPAAAQTGTSASTASHASATAEAFIAENITKGFAILKNAGLSEQQRSDQFEALLLRLTDARRIALFTLGPYAKTAPQADQDGFATAFQKYSVAVYRAYLGRFSGQTLAVTGSAQRAPDDFIVSTTLIDPNDRSGQPPMRVDFRVRTDTGTPAVTDLSVMGIWLVLAQREDIVSYLNAHGGSVPTLTAHMLDVAARYRAT